jgi:alkylation response protein AidB-like acyl-CoA dehydrogenase
MCTQVFANVDMSKGYKGITCFVMSKDMGVQIAKKEVKVSWAGCRYVRPLTIDPAWY